MLILNKMMMMPMLILSIIFPLSCNSWMSMWIGLEINLMIFIFMTSDAKTPLVMDSMMKYFLIQSSGSLLFLFSISFSSSNYELWPSFNAIVPPMALILKGGIAPLHNWMMATASNFPLLNFYLFLTIQKMIPLLIIFSSWFNMIIWLIIPNIIIGSIGGISQSSIFQLLIFSSINNSGWMMASLLISNFLFTLFIFTYSILILKIFLVLKLTNMKWILQMYFHSSWIKCFFYLNLLSLSGLPPLLGFSVKWMIISNLIYNMTVMSWIFIITSTISMFFYIKMSMNTLIHMIWMKKWMISTIKFNIMFIISLFMNIAGLPMFLMLT